MYKKGATLILATGGTACVLFLLYYFYFRSGQQDLHVRIREIAGDLQRRTLCLVNSLPISLAEIPEFN
jgi:hypothetical protein